MLLCCCCVGVVVVLIKVIVNDVHIRYEDAEADPAHPFSVGLLLENLSAQSTDEYWVGS